MTEKPSLISDNVETYASLFEHRASRNEDVTLTPDEQRHIAAMLRISKALYTSTLSAVISGIAAEEMAAWKLAKFEHADVFAQRLAERTIATMNEADDAAHRAASTKDLWQSYDEESESYHQIVDDAVWLAHAYLRNIGTEHEFVVSRSSSQGDEVHKRFKHILELTKGVDAKTEDEDFTTHDPFACNNTPYKPKEET